MIFVTVGTHEQQFNRLIKEVDRLKGTGAIDQEVFIQTGYSDFEPQNCQWSKFLSYDDMNSYMKEAEIVITHGGPATFMSVISLGKLPVVVPRRKQFGEHINDHQIQFLKKIVHLYPLAWIEDVDGLAEALKRNIATEKYQGNNDM
ncbi:multidrug MFS transporter, partial [Streptococcus agalactiae]|nr:multidrug MFS transporter [Streptococcus agalactiae]MCC9835414.1 multidrug MFS transporter [Streptococcus agalactiae]MCC9853444.1 multidrug MFS transporter [Streptococcus agalactiae]MCK6325177.1 multidrug MFS transporter [Streptococcus agalactiae]